jgi:hypothetical protein
MYLTNCKSLLSKTCIVILVRMSFVLKLKFAVYLNFAFSIDKIANYLYIQIIACDIIKISMPTYICMYVHEAK